MRLAALACLALVSAAPAAAEALSKATLTLETASGPHQFNVEVATTPQERELGLMLRPSLPENSGMLFLYETPQPIAMWMKNTIVPLDMIFIDSWGKVHRIETNTEPFSLDPIPSDGDVIGILEVNAGVAEKIGLKTGDKVIYPGLGETPQR
jgi:uncharacterized membrane protein (UPF0127 family)